MSVLKSLTLASGLAMGLLAGGKAQAGNRYAAVDIRNPTAMTITYHFRWGSDSDWKRWRLSPGEVRTHFYHYDYEDQNFSPVPQFCFHCNPGDDAPEFATYKVEALAVPRRKVGCGMRYSFRYSRDGNYLFLNKD